MTNSKIHTEHLFFVIGVLRIRLDDARDLPLPPPLGTPVSNELLASVDVRDTNTIKGFGAFATNTIPKHTFLGFYEGQIVKTRSELDRLYSERFQESSSSVEINPPSIPKGRTKSNMIGSKGVELEYVISLDGGVTFLDGYERAMCKSIFTPAHMNHAEKGDKKQRNSRCNCIRLFNGSNGVAFFTNRVIEGGEELCFDYGRNFWSGRENSKM